MPYTQEELQNYQWYQDGVAITGANESSLITDSYTHLTLPTKRIV